MDSEELNEVATLLHVTSEIATNHPQLGGIQRTCQRMLAKINADLIEEEAKEAKAAKQDQAKQQAADYKAPKPGDPNYIAPEKVPQSKGGSLIDPPVKTLPDNSNVEVERRV